MASNLEQFDLLQPKLSFSFAVITKVVRMPQLKKK